jgi:hypothetical protein
MDIWVSDFIFILFTSTYASFIKYIAGIVYLVHTRSLWLLIAFVEIYGFIKAEHVFMELINSTEYYSKLLVLHGI